MLATIIDAGKGNIRQLKYEWTLEEAYQTWEVIAVSRENERRAYDSAQKNSKR